MQKKFDKIKVAVVLVMWFVVLLWAGYGVGDMLHWYVVILCFTIMVSVFFAIVES